MIPRVFHQIWINRHRPELPEPFAALRAGWQRHHPHWQFRLWNLDNLDFPLARGDLVASSGSYAQMADVLRLEIIARHGGVYLDVDFECFKPIDALLEGVRFFAASEDGFLISNAIFGAVPDSPIVRRLVAELPASVGRAGPAAETGPHFLTRTLLAGGFDREVTLFPTAHFFPYHWSEATLSAEARRHAYAAHRWAGSWRNERLGRRTLTRRARGRLASVLRGAADAIA